MADQLRGAGISFSYGAHRALEEVDVAVAPGQWLAILGPNGCGKSTLLRVLVGFLRPTRGEVRVDGRPLGALTAGERGRQMAFLPQHGARPEGLTVEEVVALGRLPQLGLLRRPGPDDAAAVEEALRLTEVEGLRARGLATLSGGEAQRVLLARALASQPRYLLLDEPTNHLDLHHQVSFLRLIAGLRRRGVGILTVLHDANQAAQADAVLLLQGGRVFAHGAPSEVITQEALGGIYGPEVVVERTTAGRPVVLPRLGEGG